MFVTSTATPWIAAVAADNLARVLSESFIPFRAADIFAFACSERTRPVAETAKLARASSDNTRDLNFSKVSFVCLYPNVEPAVVKILYSGFNKSI